MIEIRGVHKSFNGVPVLQGVDLTIREGEKITILGRSGSGKTVLLKHIVGLIRPDRGTIRVNGLDVCRASASELYRVRERFGFVFQSAALFDSLTVFENVAFPLRERDMPEAEIRERVMAVLGEVGLLDAVDKYPAEISGGMRKRAGIARALVTEPTYVLYDEPTTGLDPVMADRIEDLILELAEMRNVTSIIVTHDIRGALKISDRIAFLEEGVIAWEGPTREVFTADLPALKEFLRAAELVRFV